jgi:hypothetical protein
MADPIMELNAVLEMCGIDNAVTCTNIITREGFMQLGARSPGNGHGCYGDGQKRINHDILT